MRLVPNRWRFVSARTIQKNGKEFTFLTFANTATFESNDFMAGRDFNFAGYPQGQDYDVTLDSDGKYTNVVALAPVAPSRTS